MIALIATLLLLLGLSKLVGEVFERIGYSAMAGELIVGIILGPSILGWILPSESLVTVAEISVFFFVMLVGLELRLSDIKNVLRSGGIIIAWGAFIFPFFISTVISLLIGWSIVSSVIVGVAVSLTALPAIVRMLIESHLLKTHVGLTIVSVALIGDIIGVSALSYFINITTSPSWGIGESFLIMVKIIVFIALIYSIDLVIEKLHQIRPGYLPARFEKLLEYIKTSEGLFAVSILTVLVFAALSEILGLHFIVGAFLGGLIMCKELIGKRHFESVIKTTRSITMAFFAPLFFAFVGVMMNLHQVSSFVPVLIILVASVSGKVLAGATCGRMVNMKSDDVKLLIVGLNAHGALELVIATVALDLALITMEQFTAIVFIVLVTLIVVPVFLRRYSTKLGLQPPQKVV